MGLTLRYHLLLSGLTLLAIFAGAPTAVRAEPRAQVGDISAKGPLRVRNLSPVTQLYGIPRMIGAHTHSGFEASFNIEAANNFQSLSREGTFAFFDGESYVTSYRLRGGLGERLEWGLEVPYVIHTGGGLDGLVDEFHELFGLPDGERSLAPRGRLDYFIRADGVVYADFDKSVRALGDARGFLGAQIVATQQHSLALRSQVKFPTGDVADLSGSEGTDVSLWGEYEYRLPFSEREVRFTLSAGAAYLGEGGLIPQAQETWVGFGHLGVQIPLHRRFEFHAQLDAHTDVLDSGNPLAAEGGVLGTLGGRLGVTPKFWVDFALIEDLKNESASDVVFQILLGADL
ncbi:MAG: DUF3187 family protein [Pseudomonadota bacterium]